jgi:hypothetical protein
MAEIRKAMEQLKEQRPVQSRGTVPDLRQRPGMPSAPVRRPGSPLPDDEEVEELESLEVEPEVVSLEHVVVRPSRVEVDQDDEAEAIVARRIKWAEDHARPLGKTDHRAFDQRIRGQPAAAPAPVRGPEGDRIAKFRRLMIWQEILGKPLGLRDRDRF